MKFLVLMTEAGYFDRPADDARDAAEMADLEAFVAAVSARGELLAGEALGPAAAAQTVRPGLATDRPVTDGPFAEAAEQLGGVFLVELPDQAAAVEAARLLPATYSIEVRPVVEVS